VARPPVRLVLRLFLSLLGVALVTLVASRLLPVNATTVGFAYLLLILSIAITWGFAEAALASVAACVTLNFFFLPPAGTLTIADPQNWIALFSFLATALAASRLSAKAERRAQEADARRQDLERLYTFSRAILLIQGGEPFARQLVQRVAEVFQVEAAVLYDRRGGEIFRGGPAEFDGLDEQLRDSARHGASFADAEKKRVITSIRLGSEPIAALALQGAQMPDSVLQGIANLVAIGLERARAQDLAHQVEAARRSEQLRTTLLDAMAHEFKTPLTSIKAATSSLRSNPGQAPEATAELLAVADEEAERLQTLIDDALEMARLDSEHIDLNREPADLAEIVRQAVASLQPLTEGRDVALVCDAVPGPVYLDRRLVRLAIRQILDNALKYSPQGTPIQVRIDAADGSAAVAITNRGDGIPAAEQARIFERFYRSASTRQQIPGTGLGLSISSSIAQAHGGSLTVASRPGETTFRLTLPVR
jgi:two-component system, OmpR family, sensor histidine kinase KdpD